MDVINEVRACPKPETYRNPAYLNFVRSKQCILCHKESVAHHESGVKLSSGSMGKKCNDLLAIPLCVVCHSRRHDQGYITFWHEVVGWQGGYGAQARIVADGIAMREIIKLQQEWIELDKPPLK